MAERIGVPHGALGPGGRARVDGGLGSRLRGGEVCGAGGTDIGMTVAGVGGVVVCRGDGALRQAEDRVWIPACAG